MSGQIPSIVKKIRSAEIRNLFSGSAKKYREQFVGRELSVLWERSINENAAWKVSGLSDNYIRVEARSVQNLYNQVTKVRIKGLNDQGLLADDLQ
jgi:tRNA A37 methylthiotransferase MiaB